jgi:hypothetical protein
VTARLEVSTSSNTHRTWTDSAGAGGPREGPGDDQDSVDNPSWSTVTCHIPLSGRLSVQAWRWSSVTDHSVTPICNISILYTYL